jgi:hypothetical protein
MDMYKSIDEVVESGYYWWLPQCYLEEGRSNDESCWSIITLVPEAGVNMDKVGLFVGPLNVPIFEGDK